MTDVAKYPRTVFWSEEDEGYIAIAPDLPGSSAFGETQAEALAQLDNAISAWIEAAKAAGNAVPAPSDPARRQDFSGKVLLRLPKSLHRSLSEGAKEEAVSLNTYIVTTLSKSEALRLNNNRKTVRSFNTYDIQSIAEVKSTTTESLKTFVYAPGAFRQ